MFLMKMMDDDDDDDGVLRDGGTGRRHIITYGISNI